MTIKLPWDWRVTEYREVGGPNRIWTDDQEGATGWYCVNEETGDVDAFPTAALAFRALGIEVEEESE